MATHSSILAWETLWTEEPGGLQSRGSQSQIQLGTYPCSIYRPIMALHNHEPGVIAVFWVVTFPTTHWRDPTHAFLWGWTSSPSASQIEKTQKLKGKIHLIPLKQILLCLIIIIFFFFYFRERFSLEWKGHQINTLKFPKSAHVEVRLGFSLHTPKGQK